MLPRLKLDIGWADVGLALAWTWVGGDSEELRAGVEDAWRDRTPQQRPIACLSVRTGFDLLLQALALPRGSEVLISAITIQDMVSIIEAHGLVPVPVDLDPDTLQPRLESLRARVTPQSRLLLMAHLFGSRFDTGDLVGFATDHNLLFIEDCAQAYLGGATWPDSGADVSMISFGPIKTATALGGAVLLVRDATVLSRMRTLAAAYPLQSTASYRKTVLRFAFLKMLSIPVVFGAFYRLLTLCGRDLEVLGGATRAFRGSELLGQIRHRPCAALSRLLRRRLRTYNADIIQERARLGGRLNSLLRGSFFIPGARAPDHTYWVFPVQVADPESFARFLRKAGFDLTPNASAMRVVSAPDEKDNSCPGAERILNGIVYLPLHPSLSDSQLNRLARVCIDALNSHGSHTSDKTGSEKSLSDRTVS